MNFVALITKEKLSKEWMQWENDFNFLPALYIIYKKLGQFFLHTLLANLFKTIYINSVTSCKYLKKLISEV